MRNWFLWVGNGGIMCKLSYTLVSYRPLQTWAKLSILHLCHIWVASLVIIEKLQLLWLFPVQLHMMKTFSIIITTKKAISLLCLTPAAEACCLLEAGSFKPFNMCMCVWVVYVCVCVHASVCECMHVCTCMYVIVCMHVFACV